MYAEAAARAKAEKAREHAAKVTGANPHYVADVKRIAKTAPELVEQIRSGKVTVPEAKRAIERTPAPAPPPKKIGRPPIADRDEMQRLYRHFDAKEVARRLGVAESTVRETAHKLGFKRTGR